VDEADERDETRRGRRHERRNENFKHGFKKSDGMRRGS